jgi:hypothetical protein
MALGNTALSGGLRTLGPLASALPGLPLVTVVTAVLNGRDCLVGCVESVLGQDYPNIEHILLDAGSSDGTVDVLAKYGDKVALWISEPDKGVYDAFLGADDRYRPGAVSAYMELARANPDAEFLSSRAQLEHPTGYAPIFGGPWRWPAFSKRMTTVHVGALHRRSLFERYGNFDDSYKIAGDYEFLLRPREKLRAAFTPAVTVAMGAGGVSDSTAGLYEARRAKVGAGVRNAAAAAADLRVAVARFHARRVFLAARSTVLPKTK